MKVNTNFWQMAAAKNISIAAPLEQVLDNVLRTLKDRDQRTVWR